MSDETRPPIPDTATVQEKRHILVGDLEALEYAVADYVAKWGTNLTGKPYLDEFGGPNIAGIPCAVANMAMTVIRKNLITSWSESVLIDTRPPAVEKA